MVTSIFCAFSARFSWLQILRDSGFSSAERAHVSFSAKHEKLELAFWLLCSMHAPLDVVEGSCNCRCHPFAARSDDVIMRFSRQTVSALTSPGLSRYSA
jgi:hypothetical protein